MRVAPPLVSLANGGKKVSPSSSGPAVRGPFGRLSGTPPTNQTRPLRRSLSTLHLLLFAAAAFAAREFDELRDYKVVAVLLTCGGRFGRPDARGAPRALLASRHSLVLFEFSLTPPTTGFTTPEIFFFFHIAIFPMTFTFQSVAVLTFFFVVGWL